jgi:NAD(P) transhydrogenase subunit alpha
MLMTEPTPDIAPGIRLRIVALKLWLGALLIVAALPSSTIAQELGSSPPAAVEHNEPLPMSDSSGSSDNEIQLVVPTKSKTSSAERAAMLISSLTIFMLAVFVGFEVITKVPPTLHTPLMSGSNAISGITIVGALLTAGHAVGGFGSILGLLAVILAMINVVGGFLVTHRMLMMFKKR